MAHETCLSSCPPSEYGLSFYQLSDSQTTSHATPLKPPVTPSCPFQWLDPDRQPRPQPVSINQYQSGRECDELLIAAHTSLSLPCGQLVVDTHSRDADAPLSPIASSESTTDESERSSCSSSSSESPSPKWQPLSPVYLPEVFGEYENIGSLDADSVEFEKGSGELVYPPTTSSIVGLELGLDDHPNFRLACTRLQDPFADPDPDPETYWRECIRQGLARQDCSSEWSWNPPPEFAYFVPSIVVTPPSDEDFDARMDVKTPIQDCLFGHRLFVPHCDQVVNVLPTMAPRGLGLDVYMEHLPFTQLPSIDDQVAQGIYSQVHVLPGTNRTGCSSKCVECWPTVEDDVEAGQEVALGRAQSTEGKQMESENVLGVCSPATNVQALSSPQGENPFWLEEDDDDLPDLDGW